MNRKLALVIGSAAVVLAFSTFVSADDKPPAKDAKAGGEHAEHAMSTEGAKAAAPVEMSYVGEVLDLACYSSHPETGSGPAHASCAKSCLDKGLPAGFLVGDQVYLAIMKDHSSPGKALSQYAGQKLTVKGVAKEVGGLHLLEISQVVPPATPGKS